MTDKTKTRKTPGGIRAGRGRTATTGGAAKRSALQGKSRSRVAERKAALLQGASEEIVAATDMFEPQAPVEPVPFAAGDQLEVRPDEADGTPGNDSEAAALDAAAPDAAASIAHGSGTSAGGSSIPVAAGEQPAEEPGKATAGSGETAEGATEVRKDAASGRAPRRRTRAKKPAATGDTTPTPTPAKTRRRTRADAAAPQPAGAVDQDAATGAEAKPAGRRKKTDSETAGPSASKQDRTSASRKSPERKASGRKARAAAEAPSGGARQAEPPSAPSRGRKAAAGSVATLFATASGGDEAAAPAATPQASPMPAAAALPGAGSLAEFFPAPGMGADFLPGLGLLSSLSGAPTIAARSEADTFLGEAAEIARIGMDANMQAAESLAGARSPAELLTRQADSMRILTDAWMRQGARISEFWLRMMRASS